MKKLLMAALVMLMLVGISWAKETVLFPIAARASTAHSAAIRSGSNTGDDGEGIGDTELYYDDGELDGVFDNDYDRFVQFVAPYNCRVVSAFVYIFDEEHALYPYYFGIYEDADGFPIREIVGTHIVGGTHDDWHEISLVGLPSTIVNENDVFDAVVIKRYEHPFMGYDTTEPLGAELVGHYYNDGTQQQWTFDPEANFMVRVVVNDDIWGPVTANPSPAPGETGVSGDTAITFEIQDANHEVNPDTIQVVVNGSDVTSQCIIAKSSIAGDYSVLYQPNVRFEAGEVSVSWNARDELGNWGIDIWSFTVEMEFDDDDFNIEETSWGVIKEKF